MPERIKAVGDWFGQFGGWILGVATLIGTVIYNNRKVAVDESALVLEKWKQFAEMHAADMTRLRAEMDKDRARLEAELDDVRLELKEVQKELVQVRKDSAEQIRARDVEIAGLKRTISQISQSTAVQLGRVKRRAKTTDETVETNEGNNATDHTGIKDALGKLQGGIGDNSLRHDNEDDMA